jgi:hypothetical protein
MERNDTWAPFVRKETPITDIALPGSIEPAQERGPKLDHATNPLQLILFFGALAAAVLFVAYMAANGSGLQWSTVRNIVLVLTLPAAMALSGVLYLIFSRLF